MVAPGADPGAVRLLFDGAKALRLDENGDLLLTLDGGEIRQQRPFIYQEAGGERRAVEGRYVLAGAHEVRFEIAGYDTTRPLVIDPVLYSTYFGGSRAEGSFGLDGSDIKLDAQGNIYITGATNSPNFPVSDFAHQRAHAGGGNDAFVAKVNYTGQHLLYSTLLGDDKDNLARGIAVNARGDAFVVGMSCANPWWSNNWDAYVKVLDWHGSILYDTVDLATAAQDDFAYRVALDADDNAHVIGLTNSTSFPTTPGALQPGAGGGGNDAFLAKVRPRRANLSVSVNAAGEAVLNRNITFDITVTNDGPEAAQGVRLSDLMSSEVPFVSCQAESGAQCQEDGFRRAVELGTLEPGQSVNVTVVGFVSAGALYVGASILNEATVTSLTYDADEGNNSAAATPQVSDAPPELQLPDGVTAEATSINGADVNYTVMATDNVDPQPSVTCAPASGSLFPIGTTAVTCTATDASGNSATLSFPVTVKSAAAQLVDLGELVKSFNLANGIENSLDGKLKNVDDALNASNPTEACNSLNAFINEVQAQSGKKIPAAQAQQLLNEAYRIKAVIGCP